MILPGPVHDTTRAKGGDQVSEPDTIGQVGLRAAYPSYRTLA